MAENIPNMPAGAVPPKPGDSAKVQPKKETVRINLPPKPTAAPTVRLPAPAPAGVAAPVVSAAAPVSGVTPSSAAAAAPAAATAAAPRPVAAVAPSPAMARATTPGPTTVVRTSMGPEVRGLDKALAIAAAVLGLAILAHLLKLSLG